MNEGSNEIGSLFETFGLRDSKLLRVWLEIRTTEGRRSTESLDFEPDISTVSTRIHRNSRPESVTPADGFVETVL